MRVLVVDERRPAECLAGLEDLRRSKVAERKRLEREHRLQPQRPACSPAPCRSHEPVLRFELVKVAKLPILQIAGEEDVRIHGPRPARVRRCDVLFVLRIDRRRPQQQRGARCQYESTEG